MHVTEAVFAELRRTTGLSARETLQPGAPRADLDEITELLVHYFPDHAHVTGELELGWRGSWPDVSVVPHAWLLSLDDTTVGFCVVHSNLRRGVLLQHYFGMDPDAGRTLPLRWVGHLMDALRDTGTADATASGVTLLGQMGEHYPEHVRAWSRFGYEALDIEYREPRFGRQWAAHGSAPDYFPMIAMLRRTDPEHSRALVATRAVEAFLLDHYQLPEDDPTVRLILDAAAALPD